MQKIQRLLRYLSLNYIKKDQINKYYEIRESPYLTKDEQDKRALSKLNKLLNYAYQNITYYHEILDNCGVVTEGNINLTSVKDLQRLPFLTKDIIRQQGENLYSAEETYAVPVTFGESDSLRGYDMTYFRLVERGKGKG